MGLLLASLIGVLAVFTKSYFIPFFPVFALVATIYLVLLFREPFVGLMVLIVYCFILFFFYREIGLLPYGVGIEIFLLLTWLSVWYNADKLDFSNLNTNLMWLYVGWLMLCVLQVLNPTGGSFRGWYQEIRGMGVYPVAISGLGLLLINSKKRITQVLKLIICLSFLGVLYGLKQKYIGLSAGDQQFVRDYPTHLIWGQLRVFSFYVDAGQYGASMAVFVVVALVLAIGLKKTSTRIMFLFSAPLFTLAMLISGTRGAFFALIVGGGMALLLTKRIKIFLGGCIVLLFFVVFLKYTNIGSGNYAVFRFRTALNPEDASLNLRFINQRKLANYLGDHPFGGGLGTIGAFGHQFNEHMFLASIEPDSYWVKVWAETGIVGFTLWFCMILYLLGKGCGITWGIRDPELRVKLIALNAAIAGVFACSYGNEVINNMPSNIFVNLSFAIIFNAVAIEKAERKKQVSK